MRALWFTWFWLSVCCGIGAEAGYRVTRTARYSGMADASGAVAVSSNLLVVASDEDSILRLYRSDRPGAPVQQFDCTAFLELSDKSPETDLEAATRLGDRIFWISSHGRNRAGKVRLNRDRLFATDLKGAGEQVQLVPVGRPYKDLLNDLLQDARFRRFHFAEAASRAPKERDALNIEGLAATPEGQLLIGFRNPIPDGKALIIPLLNPNEVVAGKRARLDAAVLLDLGGLGIRDMSWQGGSYLIIAGAYHGGGPFRLYRWAGNQAHPPEPISVHHHWSRFNPEAIVFYPERGWHEIQILSDDGALSVNGVPAKALADPRRRTFRSFWIVKE